MSGIRYYPQLDLSGGVQSATSFLMRKQNEVGNVRNTTFGKVLGAAVRRDGSEAAGNTFGAGGQDTPTGGFIAKFTTGNTRFVAVNNSGSTATIIRTQDLGTGDWSTLTDITGIPVDARVFFFLYLDEVYITGYDPATGDPIDPWNVDNTLDVSATRNILYMPACYFVQEFGGALYACNVKIGSVRYPDRAYKSSGPLGAITFVRGDQEDIPAEVDLVDNVPTMTGASTPSGAVAASTTFAGFNAYAAFDDTLTRANSWFTTAGNTSGWVRYDFGVGNSKTIKYYSIVALSTDANATDDEWCPKTWTFEGSDDASSWTVLDTQTNVAGWTGGEKRTFNISSNTTAYRYYRVNVSAIQVVGGTNLVTMSEIELMTSVQGDRGLQLDVDSVRYLKPGMNVDIYRGGTETKLFDIEIVEVDKVKNRITFMPYSLNFATSDVDTGTEVITLSSTTNFPTGTTIQLDSTGTLPTGLSADTTYYVINVSATTIKLATSLANALAGNAINITAVGSGTHRIRLNYELLDNDEIWYDGRKDKLTMFWNVDFPYPEKADWIHTRPGVHSSNAITAVRKSSNRLFLFTESSGQKYDGGNIVTYNNEVGCISQNSLQNIDDDWLVWIDQVGRVWARNDSSGQQEYISRGIYDILLKYVTQAQLEVSSAVVVNNTFKLYLGTVDSGYGNENIRITYSFDDNVWSIESLNKKALFQDADNSSGRIKPYFYSDDGLLYQDETGNTDAGAVIPYMVSTGRTNFQSHKTKKYVGAFIYSKNLIGGTVKIKIGNDEPKTVGQIVDDEGYIEFPERGDNQLKRGSSAELIVTDATKGDPQSLEGVIWAYTVEGELPRGTK